MGFIFEMCGITYESYFPVMGQVKGDVTALLWYFPSLKSDLYFLKSGSLYHFWLQLGPSPSK